MLSIAMDSNRNLSRISGSDRLRIGRGATRAEDAQGTPTQSHISPSILVYEEKEQHRLISGGEACGAPEIEFGLIFEAHRLCVSLNSRLVSNKEEE